MPGNLFSKEKPQIEENRINEIKLYEMYVYLEVTGLLHLYTKHKSLSAHYNSDREPNKLTSLKLYDPECIFM